MSNKKNIIPGQKEFDLIHIAVEPIEKKIWKSMAKLNGMTLSGFIRWRVATYIRDENDKQKKLDL